LEILSFIGGGAPMGSHVRERGFVHAE
jgi:hypothetical protein